MKRPYCPRGHLPPPDSTRREVRPCPSIAGAASDGCACLRRPSSVVRGGPRAARFGTARQHACPFVRGEGAQALALGSAMAGTSRSPELATVARTAAELAPPAWHRLDSCARPGPEDKHGGRGRPCCLAGAGRARPLRSWAASWLGAGACRCAAMAASPAARAAGARAGRRGRAACSWWPAEAPPRAGSRRVQGHAPDGGQWEHAAVLHVLLPPGHA